MCDQIHRVAIPRLSPAHTANNFLTHHLWENRQYGCIRGSIKWMWDYLGRKGDLGHLGRHSLCWPLFCSQWGSQGCHWGVVGIMQMERGLDRQCVPPSPVVMGWQW